MVCSRVEAGLTWVWDSVGYCLEEEGSAAVVEGAEGRQSLGGRINSGLDSVGYL